MSEPKYIYYAVSMPIIGYGPWNTPPDDIKNAITQSRIIQLAEDANEFKELATNIEAMWYVSTASMEFPLDQKWTDIYQHLFQNYMLDYRGVSSEELPQNLQRKIVLDLYEKTELLNPLRRDIRRTQFKHMKSLEPKGLARAEKLIHKSGLPLSYVAENTFELEDGERFTVDSLAEKAVRDAYNEVLRQRAGGKPFASASGQIQLM